MTPRPRRRRATAIVEYPEGILVTVMRYMACGLPGGSIQPGDLVDIVYTMQIVPDKFFKNPNPTVNAIDASARIVLERVPILARTLSVYVIRTDAATAERIAYLQASGGSLQLLLRAPKDDRATGTIGASFDNIQPDWKWHIPVKITP